jgi:hypothetical protein
MKEKDFNCLNGYPSPKKLKRVLEKHGLDTVEMQRISIMDSYDSNRVGYAWRGTKTTQKMEGIELTLALNNVDVIFSKRSEDLDRGFVYIDKCK